MVISVKGTPQSSILGPCVFNIQNDLMYVIFKRRRQYSGGMHVILAFST